MHPSYLRIHFGEKSSVVERGYDGVVTLCSVFLKYSFQGFNRMILQGRDPVSKNDCICDRIECSCSTRRVDLWKAKDRMLEQGHFVRIDGCGTCLASVNCKVGKSKTVPCGKLDTQKE